MHIATTMQKGALDLILQKTSAKDCWDKLTAHYQGKGGRHVAFLMESFFQMPLTDAEPMEAQLNKLIEANRNLMAIGCGVNDKTLTYIIIMAILNSLSTLKSILFNKDDTSITSDAVIEQILVDEECRIHASGNTATAYFAKAGKHPKLGSSRNWDQGD